MKLRPVGCWIVHGEHFDVVARRLRPRHFRIEARRGGHVEALGGAYPARVMNQHKRRGSVAGALDASGPVRLVAKNNIERRRAVVLRPFHQTERVIGAKDRRHRRRGRVSQRLGDRCRIGRHRNL